MGTQDESISREVLTQALKLCGGERTAQALGVAPAQIESWLSGGACPPDHLVLRALLLIEDKNRHG